MLTGARQQARLTARCFAPCWQLGNRRGPP